jgi:hypothetical protein
MATTASASWRRSWIVAPPPAGYSYGDLLVEGSLGPLTWTADGDDVDIHDGADTFVVRAGVIAAQTIHYSTRSK